MESKYIAVNGIRLHYIEEGSGDLVVLLHGFPEFWYGWRRQIPVLGRHYRVIAPDMRGYNLSDKPEGIGQYKMDVLVQDIAELIQKLGNGHAILVGHDWGAAVAWAVAATHPDMIIKLGIINVPHPLEMRRALRGFNLRQWARSYYMFLFQLPRLPEWFMARDLARTFTNVFKRFSPRGVVPTDEEIQEYVKAYSHAGALTGPIHYYRAALHYPDALDVSAVLPMPVLMIWGEQDKALGKELTYNTKQYCADLETVYDPTSGHFITADNPELVNAALLRFFAPNAEK
ncbi:MAG: alpha/beta hydrolase [Bacteroidetes bacterium]|nr:alpha/beta hydrolase [Bacteroidota bacterium]